MYAVIVGGARLGISMAKWLIAADVEVAIIEDDLEQQQIIINQLGSICINGDGTDSAALEKAGVGRAELFIATTGRDDKNLLACQLAKHHFGTARTVSLVNLPDHKTLFNLLGIDHLVSATDLVLQDMQEATGPLLVQEI